MMVHQEEIEWLKKQIKNSQDALEALGRGMTLRDKTGDVTGIWIKKHEGIINQCNELIRAYEGFATGE